MLKLVLLLCTLTAMEAPAALRAQDLMAPTSLSDPEGANKADADVRTYDWCKKDAFEFGVMGTYRRLYVLSCLGADVTATTKR